MGEILFPRLDREAFLSRQMSEPGPACGEPAPLVDSHCHLQILAERDGAAGVDRALEQAAGAGVVQIVCPGLNVEDSDRCREVAEAHPGVFFTVGWHPHERTAPDRAQLDALDQLLRHPRAVGVGEVGLDQYWRPGYHETPLQVQQAALHQMLELARAHSLPVVIHDRDSHAEVLAAVDAVPGGRGVMHSYTGDRGARAELPEARLPALLLGDRHLPPQRGHPGRGTRGRRRRVSGGDRLPLPCAGAPPRAAQHPRLRGGHRGGGRATARGRPGRPWRRRPPPARDASSPSPRTTSSMADRAAPPAGTGTPGVRRRRA